jgi:hypothetical protein
MENNMKDILKDLVAHTHSLGFINLIRVSGDETATSIDATEENRAVVLKAKTKNPYPEFKGTFGMPNLNKLDLHLKNPEYKEGEEIKVVWEMRNGENRPVAIHFENATGDFKNDYRLMGAELINEKLKKMTFNGSRWLVEFEPTIASLNRLKLQAAAHSEETTFMVKTEGDALKISFGDASTHEGSFVFQSGITGKLKQSWSFPVTHFISILNLGGNKTIKFGDDGIALITVDSGLTDYEYLIPAMTK